MTAAPPQGAELTPQSNVQPSSFDDLPSDLMMWVLIVSELLVFGAGLAGFLAVRLTDPAGFAAAQDHLHRSAAGFNTLVLETSGCSPHSPIVPPEVLGCTRDHKPRHTKVYAEFASEYARLQDRRVKAFGAFRANVDSGVYPEKSHTVSIADDEFAAFVQQLSS